MVIGSGQLAQVFNDLFFFDVCIFASGVSDSTCIKEAQFKREKQLLLKTLSLNKAKKFVYFSSCALSASEYPKNAYYQHKQQMEELIKIYSNSYYIFRIPQLFGALKHHKTLINFLYESIVNGEPFTVYSQAYRYVIEIGDVRKLVEVYLQHHESCITVDLANPYRYKVTQIVEIFEKLLGKKALYKLVDKEDGYFLNLSEVTSFIKKQNIKNIKFSKDYIQEKLKEQLGISN